MRAFLFLLTSFGYLFFLVLNTEHTAWTEMLTYPYLLNNGFILYKELTAPYTPIILWILQLVTIFFGYSFWISIGFTLLLTTITVFLIFFISGKISPNKISPYISVVFYLLWFFYLEGNGLWFELFLTPLVLIIYYIFYRYFFEGLNTKLIFIGGVLLGVGFFSKQSIIWIVPTLLTLIIWNFRTEFKKLIKQLVIFVTGFILIGIIVSVIAYLVGYGSEYYNWVFYYTFFQFPLMPGHKDYPEIQQVLKLVFIVLPVFLSIYFFGNKLSTKNIYNLLFVIPLVMFAMPRWGLFHLQPFLAILAIIFGLNFKNSYLKDFRKATIYIAILVFSLIIVVRQDLRFFGKEVRFFEDDKYKLAEEIKSKNLGNLYIFNGPDQVYILTSIVPGIKPYVQNFSWYMEVPGMQERVIGNLEREKVKFIIYYRLEDSESFEIGKYTPKRLIDYIENNYEERDRLSDGGIILVRKK